ncbi:reductive dehalogenase membrane anchor [Dehalococcoides mccartyi]|uniref:hypothetical protein n=1 Tax=Dehalococcoides mccartyi TaxID=61435 RepID=UPI000150C727|nr:hypothetical protein [Dehalococcoides mccartyi]AQW61968.1 reductive dehalogenase membrane anchor [Dehalococcoides mccartyi]
MTLILLLVGVAMGIFGTWLWNAKNKKNIKLTFIEYLLLAFAVIIFSAGVLFVKTFVEESETNVALMSGLVSSITALILLATTWQLVKRHN